MKKPAASEPVIREIHVKDLTGRTPEKTVYSRSVSAIIIMLVFAFLMIALKMMPILGWILLVLCSAMLAFGNNHRQFAFYPDCLVIFALDDSGIAWQVPYQAVQCWHLKRSLLGLSQLTIITAGADAQRMEMKSYQYHALHQALVKAMPKQEVSQLPDPAVSTESKKSS